MEIIDQLTTQSPKAALAFALCFIGFFLKKSPLPNWVIPILLMVSGGVAYPFIAAAQNIDYTSALITTNVIIGITLGGASVGLHQLLKNMFPVLFPSNGDTQIIKNDEKKP